MSATEVQTPVSPVLPVSPSPLGKTVTGCEVKTALASARSAGIELSLDGEDLALTAPTPPPPAVLELIARHKAEIVLWLRPGADGWSLEDWHVYFDKCGFGACVVEWLNRNPVCSPSDHCLWCGGQDELNNLLLPFGAHPDGRAWLHGGCWPDWSKERKAEAIAALGLMGLVGAASVLDQAVPVDDRGSRVPERIRQRDRAGERGCA